MVKDLVENAGYERPARALVRASTGDKPGFFALVYFMTEKAAVQIQGGWHHMARR